MEGIKQQPIDVFGIVRRRKIARISLAVFAVLCFAGALTLFLRQINRTFAKAEITPKESGKNVYQSSEMPAFTIDTAGVLKSDKPEKTRGSLRTTSGTISGRVTYNEAEIDLVPEISSEKNGSDIFEVLIPKTNQFKPGKYHLDVILQSAGGEDLTLSQDFSWGVLAINFNQSSYRSGEEAVIGIAILDDHGVTECNPRENLKLTITSPHNRKKVLSTTNGQITISSTCHNGNVTNEFDYRASYMPEEEGNYQVTLEAETSNGRREMYDSFSVLNNPKIVIRRLDTSMRIFPEAPYTVNVEIEIIEPVNGRIEEKVPVSFALSNISTGGVLSSDFESQNINWPINSTSPSRIQLSYTYDAPDISPEFYLLGPIEIWQNRVIESEGNVGESLFFAEPRSWQIATDATACSSSTTTGTMNWGTATTWASPCNVSGGPTSNNDVTITNTAKVITVEASTTRQANSITFTGGTSVTTIQLSTSGGAVLNVLGTGAGGYGIQINSTGNGGTKTVAVAQNTLSATSIRLVGGTSTKIAQVTVSSGNITTSGSLTYTGTAGTSRVVFTGAGTFNVGGDFLPGAFTQSTGKINANGSGNQTLGAFTYYNLDISNSASSGYLVTFSGNAIVGGALNVTNGNLETNDSNFSVTGATTLTNDGRLTITSNVSTVTFTGLVTVNASAEFMVGLDLSAGPVASFNGGITNYGSCSILGPNDGSVTFSANQSFSGSSVIIITSAVTINSGVVLTNNNSAGVIFGAITAGSSASGITTGNNSITTFQDVVWTTATKGVLTPAATANTIIYSGSSQTVAATTTNPYYHLSFTGGDVNNVTLPSTIASMAGNLTLQGTSNVTTGAALTISGNLSVGANAALITGATNTWTLTVSGTTDVIGTLTLANTGTKTFTGNVTLNAGSVWDETGAAAYIFSGSLTNNATTFTANTGTHTFSGASKTISGSTTTAIPALTINGATANSGTLTVSTALAGSNTLTQNNGATLNIGASSASMTITGLAASTATNTVNYNGSGGQTVKDTSDHHYSNLTITCGAGTATLAAAIVVDNDLTISSGTLDVSGSSHSLTVSGNWSNSGSFNPQSGVVTFNKSSSTQTLDSGGTTAGKIFNGLTHSGAGTLQLVSNAINIDSVFSNSNGAFDANDLDMSVADDFLISGGSFSADVSPGATTQTVVFDGTNESTISGSSTFRNLTMNTTTDGAKTVKFTQATTQTINGTWTLDGDVGKVLTLRSTSDGNAWKFAIPANINPSGDYIDVKDSQNTTNAYRITAGTYYVNSGNNDPGWIFPSANTAPNNPTSLIQKKVTCGATLSTGDWTNETQVIFEATASDTDNPDTLYLCVEKDLIATALSSTNGGDLCGTGVAYSGTPVTVSVTITGLTDANQYHWQAQVKDEAGEYSSFVSYAGNTENPPTNPADRDFGVDTTAPTGGSVYDGTSGDQDWNNGSLTQISGNWTGINSNASGLVKYEYAIRRASDNYYWSVCSGAGAWQLGENWCNNSTLESFTQNNLNLQTGVTYYVSVKTTDNAGNVSSPVSSNGQQVLPTLTFSYSSNTINFSDLNNTNDWTDTKTNSFTTSTNAAGGYTIKGYIASLLTSLAYPSVTIPNFSYNGANWSSPQTWPAGEYGFGYTSNDTLVQGSNRFLGATKYCPFILAAPGDIVADHTDAVNGGTGAVADESFTVTYKVAVSQTQESSAYQAQAFYIVTANY